MRIEQAAFYTGPGYRLAAEVYIPDGLAKGERRPGVVICHGYTAIKTFIVPDVAAAFCKKGYVCLIFDHRGFGESEGPRWRFIPTEQADDIRDALTFMETRQEVDQERLGLVGVSYGGANAVYVAAHDKRVKCVTVNGAIGNGEAWLHNLRRQWEWEKFLDEIEEDRRNRVLTGKSRMVGQWDILLTPPDPTNYIQKNLEKYPDFKCQLPLETAEAIINYKPENYVHLIAPTPLLLVHAEKDPLVPTDQSMRMYERAKDPKELIIMRVKNRMELYQSHFELVMEHETAWFERWLPATTSSARAGD